VNDTPDLRFYLAIHRAMRASADQLHAAATDLAPGDTARVGALGWWFKGLAGELRTHHHIEDEIFFPALAARVPTYADHADEVVRDHTELGVLMNRITEQLGALAEGTSWVPTQQTVVDAAADLRDLLYRHLGLEDDDIVPLFGRHFSRAEYDAMHESALKQSGLKQLAFTVPWIVSHLDGEERARTLAEAPLPMRLLWRVTRRGYARRAAYALGTGAPLPVL
jgi:hypothetical protein